MEEQSSSESLEVEGEKREGEVPAGRDEEEKAGLVLELHQKGCRLVGPMQKALLVESRQ